MSESQVVREAMDLNNSKNQTNPHFRRRGFTSLWTRKSNTRPTMMLAGLVAGFVIETKAFGAPFLQNFFWENDLDLKMSLRGWV